MNPKDFGIITCSEVALAITRCPALEQTAAPAVEHIEITDEMMKAGTDAYAEWNPGDWRPEAKIIDIYTAMARARPKR
jgi:hypothetical protein